MAKEVTLEDVLRNQVTLKGGEIVPLKHAQIIKANFEAGKPWDQCSPLYKASRSQVAEIATMNLPKP